MAVSFELFNHVYSTCGAHSSWAVWGNPDGTVPVTAHNLAFADVTPPMLDVLHTDVVTVALNRGNGTMGAPLSTFHTSARSKDHVLGEALRTTPAWGALMTDLDASTVDSDAASVTVGRLHVERLLERLADATREDDATSRTYVLFGSQVRDAFARYTKETGVELRTVGLLHYSGLALIHAKSHYARVTGNSAEGLSQADAYIGYVRATLNAALGES
jgi:hypothetical protein